MREHRIKLGNIRMEVSLSEVLEVVSECSGLAEASSLLAWDQKSLREYLLRNTHHRPYEKWSSTAIRHLREKKQLWLFSCPEIPHIPTRPLVWVNRPTGEEIWDI